MPVEHEEKVSLPSKADATDSSNRVYCLAIDVNPNINNSNNCSLENYPISPLKPKRSQGDKTHSDYLQVLPEGDRCNNQDDSTCNDDEYITIIP